MRHFAHSRPTGMTASRCAPSTASSASATTSSTSASAPSKGLWYAAVDRAFSQQVTQLATAFDPTLTDPLDQLNQAIRRFVSYSAERPSCSV